MKPSTEQKEREAIKAYCARLAETANAARSMSDYLVQEFSLEDAPIGTRNVAAVFANHLNTFAGNLDKNAATIINSGRHLSRNKDAWRRMIRRSAQECGRVDSFIETFHRLTEGLEPAAYYDQYVMALNGPTSQAIGIAQALGLFSETQSISNSR